MEKVAAIFDVDQTLVRGHTERLFFWYLVRQGRLKLGQVLIFFGRLAAQPQARFRNKTYLQGMEVEEVAALARRCYRELIAPRLSPLGLACVREHQAQGHRIVVLTGSLAFLVRPLKEELAADWLIATELVENGACLTGEIRGLHPRGKNKWQLLWELSQAQGFDLSRSYAYGDHFQDFLHFRSVGHPVAVNPSFRLKRLAQRYHWPIRYF
ncbi:MAG: HAD-IB family hydrolase [Thermodesulfobacteriota bacterium]